MERISLNVLIVYKTDINLPEKDKSTLDGQQRATIPRCHAPVMLLRIAHGAKSLLKIVWGVVTGSLLWIDEAKANKTYIWMSV